MRYKFANESLAVVVKRLTLDVPDFAFKDDLALADRKRRRAV
jgi:hypothetical protein